MSSPDFLNQAREGDAGAIAAYLAGVLTPQGLRVKVAQQQGQLHIALTAETDLDPEPWSQFVDRALRSLQVPSQPTWVYGCHPQQPQPIWSRELEPETEAQDDDPAPAPTRPRHRGRWLLAGLLGLLTLGGAYLVATRWVPAAGPTKTPGPTVVTPNPADAPVRVPIPAAELLRQGKDLGWQAAVAARDIRRSPTAAGWQQVAQQWSAAIARLEEIPAGDPLATQAQIRLRDYRANRAIALAHAQALP